MSLLDLLRNRKALANGVGLSTRRNKVLPAEEGVPAIPARTGTGKAIIHKSATLPTGTRTFVFKVFGASIGVIANKFGSGLYVLVSSFAAGVVSYAIGALKTDTNKWYDVLRLETTTFHINGRVPAPVLPIPSLGATSILSALMASYGATALPWVGIRSGAYVATMVNSGDYIRSSLFIGVVDSATRKVVSFSSSGYPRAGDPPWNFTYSYSPSNGHLAGLRLTPGGKYHSYAARFFAFPSPGDDSISDVQAMRSTFTASLASPYLSGPDNSTFVWSRYLNPVGLEYTSNYIAYQLLPIVSDMREIQYNDSDAASSGLTVSGTVFPASPPIRIPWWSATREVVSLDWHDIAHNLWDLTYNLNWDSLEALDAGKLRAIGQAWAHDVTQTTPLIQSIPYGYAGEDIPFTLTSTLTQHLHYRRREDFTNGDINPDLPTDPNASAQRIDTIDHLSDIYCNLSAPSVGPIYTLRVISTDALTRGCRIVPGSILPPDPPANESNIFTHVLPADLDAFLATHPKHFRQANATVEHLDTGTSSLTLSVKTVDHLYADIDEGVYLSIEGEITSSTVETFTPTSAPHSHAMPIGISDVNGAIALNTPVVVQTQRFIVKYVLTVRGTRTEWPVYDSTDFVKPLIAMRQIAVTDLQHDPIFTTLYTSYPWHYDGYHLALQPPPIFNPAFMHQGNCPYIAYTTAVEEAQISVGPPVVPGATPEIYVDFRIQIEKYSTWAASQTTAASRYGGTVHFIPAQLLFAFRQYIGGESLIDGSLSQNAGLWDTIFPASTPFAVQFCNGVKGAWSSQLGTGFSGSPAVEITRV